MPTFTYSGIDRRGRRQAGTLAAADERELESLLRVRGLWLLDSKAGSPRRMETRGLWMRAGRRELILFCTLLEFQARVGVPLIQSLDTVAQEGESPRFSELVVRLRQRVEGGSTLAEAMAEWPRVFQKDLVQLVRAGEQSGSLPEAFHQARRHLEWQERVAAEVKQATIYPALVLLVTVAFVAVLFTVVVPKFVGLLAVVKVPLPLPTRLVFTLSTFARGTGGWLVLSCVSLAAVAIGSARRSTRVALWVDRQRLRLPVLGAFVRLLVMIRFAHNLGLLYRNGLSLPNALELVSGIMGSPVMARAVLEVRDQVLQGASLSAALKCHAEFPQLLVRLVMVGERTGQLDDALEQLATHYHELLPRRLKRLLALIEPTLILGLVCVVGLVALAVILPVLSLMQSLR